MSAAGGRATPVRRAEMLASAGRPAEAIALLTRHLASEPDDAAAWFLLAHCQLSVGRRLRREAPPGGREGADMTREARRAAAEGHRSALRAVELRPHKAATHRLLANALLDVGEVDAALAAAREATRLAPQAWRELWTLGRMMMESAARERDPERRRAGLEEALDVAERSARAAPPEDPTPHKLTVNILERLGRHAEAAETWERVVAADPTSAEAHDIHVQLRERVGGSTVAERLRTLVARVAESPGDWSARHALDVQTHRLLRRLRLVALVALGVVALGRPLGVGVGVGLAVGLAVGVTAALRGPGRLPRGVWRGMRRLCLRVPVVALAPAAALWCLGCAFVIALVPLDGEEVAAVVEAGAVPALVTVGVDAWWRRRQAARVRRGRLDTRDWYGARPRPRRPHG
ncbi:tetratricopeptide repeat protein [Streptomyces sp. 4N509B]|uniref:tetratricopeptide repeat protein n=1 Tax=Streptomyces sp. 4N509B TaxID=3457413 RepID=UPI003FD53DB5